MVVARTRGKADFRDDLSAVRIVLDKDDVFDGAAHFAAARRCPSSVARCCLVFLKMETRLYAV